MSDLPAPSRRRRALKTFLLLFAFAALGLAGTLWYVQVGQWYESTDNAYVSGNRVMLSSKVQGVVVHIANDENDYVMAGEPLVRLSTGDADRALVEAKDLLSLAVQEVMTYRAQVKTAESRLRLRQTTHRQARDEYQRRRNLVEKKMVSQEEVDAARTRFEETQVELDTARNELTEIQVRAGAGQLKHHPMVRLAASRLHDTYRQLNKHTLYAPISGRVARRNVQAGQVIDAGAPLMTLIEENNLWVEANFKETQLGNLRVGQSVSIEADVYGRSQVFRGRITSFGGGTGASFAVLPAQNATGNWIKIVQRVPVRIDFEQQPDTHFPLPIGASLVVTVDTHQRNADRSLIGSNAGEVSPEAFYEDLDDGIDELIDAVIEEHVARVGLSADG